MFDVKVSANTPAELTAAIVALAAALQSAPAPANPTPAVPAVMGATSPMPPAATSSAPTTPQTAPSAPPAYNAVPANPAPVTPPPAAPAAVPVVPAPTFTREQIMTAGAALIDAGKMNELLGLLNSFGVQAVTQLKQEQLGAFATELRKLGAQI